VTTERSALHRTCHHKIYGMTCGELERLIERAGGRCELCGIRGEDAPRGILCIDHDQRYGFHIVRGLLCDKCNSHMGLVDRGERTCGGAEYDYYRHAWFKDVWTHRAGRDPLRAAHPGWDLWRRFGEVAGPQRRHKVVRDLIGWYASRGRTKLPMPPAT
jgi:hypothetical protein